METHWETRPRRSFTLYVERALHSVAWSSPVPQPSASQQATALRRKRQLEPSDVAGGGPFKTLSELAQDFAFITWTPGLEAASRVHLTRQPRETAESRSLSQTRPDPDLRKSGGELLNPFGLQFLR
ncbi:unnamed protein product [Rangifer tarandus platyrhynchus]|uniref:Uncharacterized protein n=1 Tax=Rangifer tarandus platyrhynchus TaxID=3082113 RepID=A0AC60A933_RANTA